MATQPLPGVQVIGVRYRGSKPAVRDERALDAYTASGVYQSIDVPVTVIEPRFPEDRRTGEPTDDLGLMGAAIASAAANARREGNGVMMVGGDCSHITGVLGGLQDVYGPNARIGLVWFDAHGDFNTPNTTFSGMLGGMPVAVSAGLAYPRWREMSHIAAPIPTDRILMVDVRNLDEPEEALIRATDITIAAPAPGFPGADLKQAVTELAANCDMLYFHIDSDILDEAFVPNHGTREPNGPDLQQVQDAIETVMATGKVVAYAVVSVYAEGEGSETSVQSGIELLRGGLEAWNRHGLPESLNDA
ncbi:MAG: arginase family protein [Chloroflexia bacterium]|nr:arginase family protein [Chloroflexia bacterium]